MIRIRHHGEPPDPPDPPWRLDASGSLVQWLHPAPASFVQPPVFPLPRQAPPHLHGGHAGAGEKYELRMSLRLGNPNDFSISLDTIVIQFEPPDGLWTIDDMAEQRTTFTSDGQMKTTFTYRTPAPAAAPEEAAEDETHRAITIAGHRGIELPGVPIGGNFSGGHRPMRLRAMLLHAGSEIAYPLVSQLPPRSAIPEVSTPTERRQGAPLPFALQIDVSTS